MDLGLLGAIGGAGQALQTAGADIIKRREQALENARKDAEDQQREAQRMTEIQVTHNLDMEEINTRETAADARTQKEIDARAASDAADRTDRKAEREQDRSFRASESQKDRDARVELARLTNSLEGARSASEINLRHQLQADDVKSVQYGAPDAQGYSPVFVVTSSGAVKPTGKKVYRPETTNQVVAGNNPDQL